MVERKPKALARPSGPAYLALSGAPRLGQAEALKHVLRHLRRHGKISRVIGFRDSDSYEPGDSYYDALEETCSKWMG